jgi:maltose O-acetyltransferase
MFGLGLIRGKIEAIIEKRIREDWVRKGLKMGKNVSMGQGCMVDAFCWLVSIGNHVALGSNVQIITHDASVRMPLGYDKIGRVVIGDDVFVGQGSIILPNVKIGNRVVIGAGSVVTKDIPSNSVACGNPAHVISTMDEYLEKNRIMMKKRPNYDKSFNLSIITPEKKIKQIKELNDGIGYLE